MRHHTLARVAALAALVVASGILATGGVTTARAAPSCTEVTNSEGEVVTAARVVRSGEQITITGQVDATQCAIGVYIERGGRAIISNADIYGSAVASESGTTFGVYNNQGSVTITDSRVHSILGNGESCGGEEDDGGCGGMGGSGSGSERSYSGGEHGTGILILGSGASGTISGTAVSNFGRRGISVSGPGAYAHIAGSTITGQVGGVEGAWRNGIWIANGARATISGNTISDNITGASGKASSGIMVAGGASHNGMPNYTTGVQITGNTLVNNDTGILLSNTPTPSEPTNIRVSGNTVRTARAVANNMAGIKDAGGRGDSVIGNYVYGYGPNLSIVFTNQAVDYISRGNTIG